MSEAIVQLEVEGLLESRPRAGTRVRLLDASGVRGYAVVREALEVQAARRFVELATRKERDRVRGMAAELDDRCRLLDSAFERSHRAFHLYLARCSGSDALLRGIDTVNAALSASLATAGPAERPQQALHRELATLLAAEDVARAEGGMRSHVRAESAALLARLETSEQSTSRRTDRWRSRA